MKYYFSAKKVVNKNGYLLKWESDKILTSA